MVCPGSIHILASSFRFFGYPPLQFGFFGIYYRSEYDSLAFTFLFFQGDIFMNSLIPTVPGLCLWTRPLINKRNYPVSSQTRSGLPSLHLLTVKFKRGFQHRAISWWKQTVTILPRSCAPPEIGFS